MLINDYGAANDDCMEARPLDVHYDELLSDFRRRMDIALKALRDYEDAVRVGEYM